MGKFFGLLACIGTAALVSGCSNPQNGSAVLGKFQNQMDQQQDVERTEMIEGAEDKPAEINENRTNATCLKNEADQKISEAAELNAVSAALVAEEQETVHTACDGKETNVGLIIYPTETAVVITGPQVTSIITSVEVSSDRTCAKIESESKVADVNQAVEGKDLILEADGDVRLNLTNSNLKGMTVAEGKNLLKIKYFECAESTSTTSADGSVAVQCVKKNLLAEKEVVVNAALTKQLIDGVRKINNCEKPADKPKTDGQE